MSLSSSLFSGVSGLMSYGQAMDVIGDNIANVNTVGFKGSKSVFADILSHSVSNGSATLQIGRGSMLQNVNLSFAQGSFETTGNATDMAVQGTGFFIVNQGTERYYTRAGQFTLNSASKLANPNGLVVQGYQLDTNGVARGSLGDIDLSGVQSQPKASTYFRLGSNLNANASSGTVFQSAVNLYSSLGQLVTLTISFTKQTGNNWNYSMAATTTGAASGSITVTGGTGTVGFSTSGQLTSPTTNPAITITGVSGASPISVTWNLINSSTGSTYGDMTGYAANSVTNSLSQDGYATGTLKALSVDQDGIVSGLFSNGQTQKLRQIGLSNFSSPWGLTRTGNSLFAESATSGQPVLGLARAGGFGSIAGSSLEQSNIDLGTEFVTMIQTQRGYQANSRIITTADEMMTEAVNLKR
ncbi:MAG: flagellar hook protein FlgE [Nitrospinae bacterium]|nr:flagellar hook protein FlgE [Nitrospinota bacterium]